MLLTKLSFCRFRKQPFTNIRFGFSEEMLTIEQFSQIDLRVGEIVDCTKVKQISMYSIPNLRNFTMSQSRLRLKSSAKLEVDSGTLFRLKT